MLALKVFQISWCSAFIVYDGYWLITSGNLFFLVCLLFMIMWLVLALRWDT